MKDITNTSSFSQNVKQLKATYSKDSGSPFGQQVSAAAHEKNELIKAEHSQQAVKQQNNQAIVQSHLDVSVNAGNEPMALLYKVAIEGINDVLRADYGDNAIQAAYDSGLDVSPQATADRIVSLSSAFFAQYKEQNSEMSDEEAAKSFAEIISSGIDQGFAEAREILTGLNVLEGDIASNIDTTYDLVQDGLTAFVESYQNSEELK